MKNKLLFIISILHYCYSINGSCQYVPQYKLQLQVNSRLVSRLDYRPLEELEKQEKIESIETAIKTCELNLTTQEKLEVYIYGVRGSSYHSSLGVLIVPNSNCEGHSLEAKTYSPIHVPYSFPWIQKNDIIFLKDALVQDPFLLKNCMALVFQGLKDGNGVLFSCPTVDFCRQKLGTHESKYVKMTSLIPFAVISDGLVSTLTKRSAEAKNTFFKFLDKNNEKVFLLLGMVPSLSSNSRPEFKDNGSQFSVEHHEYTSKESQDKVCCGNVILKSQIKESWKKGQQFFDAIAKSQASVDPGSYPDFLERSLVSEREKRAKLKVKNKEQKQNLEENKKDRIAKEEEIAHLGQKCQQTLDQIANQHQDQIKLEEEQKKRNQELAEERARSEKKKIEERNKLKDLIDEINNENDIFQHALQTLNEQLNPLGLEEKWKNCQEEVKKVEQKKQETKKYREENKKRPFELRQEGIQLQQKSLPPYIDESESTTQKRIEDFRANTLKMQQNKQEKEKLEKKIKELEQAKKESEKEINNLKKEIAEHQQKIEEHEKSIISWRNLNQFNCDRVESKTKKLAKATKDLKDLQEEYNNRDLEINTLNKALEIKTLAEESLKITHNQLEVLQNRSAEKLEVLQNTSDEYQAIVKYLNEKLQGLQQQYDEKVIETDISINKLEVTIKKQKDELVLLHAELEKEQKEQQATAGIHTEKTSKQEIVKSETEKKLKKEIEIITQRVSNYQQILAVGGLGFFCLLLVLLHDKYSDAKWLFA